jgi:hypothetical protein
MLFASEMSCLGVDLSRKSCMVLLDEEVEFASPFTPPARLAKDLGLARVLYFPVLALCFYPLC